MAAKFPDLNPIECLWDAIKPRLKQGGIRTRNGAIQLIQNVWSGFDRKYIHSLVDLFENRVEMMEEAESRPIQPPLSAGKSDVPLEYAEAVRSPATWNEQLDEILVRMVDERGRRWRDTSGFLGDFTESECKNWWMFLTNLKRLRSGDVMFTPN
jgi:hypothetical protein